MKLSKIFAIIGIILILTFYIPIHINQNKKIESDQLKIKYCRIIDTATKDGLNAMIQPEISTSQEVLAEGRKDNYKTMKLNLNKALNSFYKTLYINMNIENDPVGQEILKHYIPLKLALGYDGYYINAMSTIRKSNGEVKIIEGWRDKKTYSMLDEKNNIGIDFTLDDHVKVLDCNTKKVHEGTAAEMNKLYPNSVFGKDFNNIKTRVITDHITADLTHFSENNNKIALENGLRYYFKVPYIDSRSIKDISFIAFFQGLPVEGLKDFNTYGFGISEIITSTKYFGNTLDGKKVYHKKGCENLGQKSELFNTPIEAAKNGYTPCPKCIN